MRASLWLVILRLASLLALGVSVALLSDYTSAEPSFCSAASGCGAVRESGFGYLPLPGLGLLPVPVLGIVGFLGIFAASLLNGAELRAKMTAVLCYSAGLGGAGFIAFQAYLGHFCSLCMTVDLLAIVTAFCVFVLSRRGWSESWQDEQTAAQDLKPGSLVLSLFSWMGLAVLAVAGPLLYPRMVQVSEVPPSITSLYASDSVTIVEFFDYQCSHCRELSPRLKQLVKTDSALSLRLGYSPLPGHQLAHDAARVTICAAEQGKEWEVAGALFAGPDLSLAVKVAEAVVDDQRDLKECLSSSRPDKRIEDDTQRLKTAGFVGLPTSYVGATKIMGAQEDIVYLDAFRRAKDGSDRRGVKPWVYWLAVFAGALAVALAGWVRAKSRP